MYGAAQRNEHEKCIDNGVERQILVAIVRTHDSGPRPTVLEIVRMRFVSLHSLFKMGMSPPS